MHPLLQGAFRRVSRLFFIVVPSRVTVAVFSLHLVNSDSCAVL